MAKKKKNKKKIAKRQTKASQRKTKKRKLRLVKTKQQGTSNDGLRPGGTQSIWQDEMDIPSGFRAIGISGAFMEFAKSLEKHPDIQGFDSIEDNIEDTLQLSMPLWNYTIAQEQGEKGHELKSEIIRALMEGCKMSRDEAAELMDKVVAHKQEMFPPDIQPHGSGQMYMRKVVRHLIAPFNYDRLTISDKVIPAAKQDVQFLSLLHEVDEVKLADEDYEYDEFEEQYQIMEEKCQATFEIWLEEKEVAPDYIDGFGFFATFFLNFIYRYCGAETLRHVDINCLEEYFEDFVLRKMILDPHEHVAWVPALRLFFIFLAEKGYLETATPYVIAFNKMEEPFLELLRKEYG